MSKKFTWPSAFSFLIVAQWLSAQTLPEQLTTLLEKNEMQGIELSVRDTHCDEQTDICYFYLQQRLEGIPIYNYISTVGYHSPSQSLILNDQIAKYKAPKSTKSSSGAISHKEAIHAILKRFEVKKSDFQIKRLKSKSEIDIYKSTELSSEDITVEEVYLLRGSGLIKTYQIEIYLNDIQEWWQVLVDQADGTIRHETSYTTRCDFGHLHATHDHSHHHAIADHIASKKSKSNSIGSGPSYTVYAAPMMSPDDGARTMEMSPWETGLPIEASPYGWHDTNGSIGAEYEYTRGNNVYAYSDTNADNAPDVLASPSGGAMLNFDFPLDLSDEPEDYIDAAVTNLFYWNNILHDIFYQYGFDESAGNFQVNNYGRGGAGADLVAAEALDGSGTNNANFSCPPDGFMPRMQMYKWTVGTDASMTLNGATELNPESSSFTPMTSFSGDLVLATPVEACGALTNAIDIDGNIAVIDRGSCLFIEKVNNAKNAGAIGVIVVNNENSTFTMSGDSLINIPAVMVSSSEGDIIKSAINGGTANASITLIDAPDRDSDLDNGVITHEYGHGVSIRLTGGPSTSSCLSNDEQMGEGWSDYFALAFTMDPTDMDIDPRGMGNYLLNKDESQRGIRNYPYTTDMSVNPLTYADIDGLSIPHGVGSVWATALWDLHWALTDLEGFDSDIYAGTGGNNIAMQLVMTGLKLQPCNPGFLDGRDAILQADELLYDGTYRCLIWDVFARRGMGYSADQGSSSVVGDETEAFDVPDGCDALVVDISADQSVVYTGDTIQYTIKVKNNTSSPILNVSTIDTILYPLNVITESITKGTYSSGVIEHDSSTLSSNHQITISYSTITEDQEGATVESIDNVESEAKYSMDTIVGQSGWQISTAMPHWGTQHYYIPNVEGNQTHQLYRSYKLFANPVLSFWHKYDTETAWDGGYVEISRNGGQTWLPLDDYFLQNGHNYRMIESSNPATAGRMAFSGDSGGYIHSLLDLSSFAFEEVIVRFVFGSDLFAFEDGWYIDDITLYEAVPIYNRVQTSADGQPIVADTVVSYYLPNCVDCTPVYNCQESISINSFDQNSYHAGSTISSSAAIPEGRCILLRAGSEIELLGGFEVPSNTILITQNEGCD